MDLATSLLCHVGQTFELESDLGFIQNHCLKYLPITKWAKKAHCQDILSKYISG